jgi:hypothetical protein
MSCIELGQPRAFLPEPARQAWRLAAAALSVRRPLPRLWILMLILGFLGVAIPAGNQWAFSSQSSGAAIRHELARAAAEMRAPGPEARESDKSALLRHFPHERATLDTRFWPEAVVTLHGLDRLTCIDAADVAGRIDGLVVVQLEGYAAPTDCKDMNDMSWRIMP